MLITTQNGDNNEGLHLPSSTGLYKVELEMKYSSGNNQEVSGALYVEVYGPAFRVANLISTVNIPSTPNLLLLEFIPANTIATTEQFVIEIPTVSVDGSPLFPADLGMGYEDYDDLIFDLYESAISSMDCKVYIGNVDTLEPIKIVCSNFNTQITTSTLVKMGFWTVNPSSAVGLAIPVQIYSFDTYRARKDTWSIIEAGIRVIPTDKTPITDLGNFDVSSTFRQYSDRNF